MVASCVKLVYIESRKFAADIDNSTQKCYCEYLKFVPSTNHKENPMRHLIKPLFRLFWAVIPKRFIPGATPENPMVVKAVDPEDLGIC